MRQIHVLTAVLLIVSVSVAGAVEAVRSDHTGYLGLFLGLAVAGISLLFQLSRMRRAVLIRTDIAHWVDSTSAITGESPEDLVNRALSSYRAGLSDDRRV